MLMFLAACSDPVADPSAPLALAPLAARADSVGNWREVRLVIDKCGAPNVVVTGGYHETYRLDFDETGGLHRGYHLNFRLVGESADGTHFSYNGVQNSEIYFANPPFTDMTELRLRMNAQGNREDFIQIFRYHQTIDANGEITSSFEAVSEECGQGGSGE